MAFCSQCSNELIEGARFCPNCGTEVGLSEPSPQAPAPAEAVQGRTGNGASIPPAAGQIPKDIRNVAMLCHLSAFAGYFIPFGHILGPLLVWLLKREESAFIDAHGKEALNFQISVTIYAVISAILILVVIGFLLLPILLVFEIIVVIIAAVRANNGLEYRYPVTIRFIKDGGVRKLSDIFK